MKIIYLPFSDFESSAEALDFRRLGIQRRDVHELLKSMLEGRTELINPNLLNMWLGYESAIANYGIALSKEIDRRGYRDPWYYSSFSLAHRYGISFVESEAPYWLGEESLHRSHRSALIRETSQEIVYLNHALKNRERLKLSLTKHELKDRLKRAQEEYEWYENLGWKEDLSIPLVWPKI